MDQGGEQDAEHRQASLAAWFLTGQGRLPFLAQGLGTPAIASSPHYADSYLALWLP